MQRTVAWWRARSRGQHWLLLSGLAVLSIAVLTAIAKNPSNAFAVSARTSVVTVEPSCGRHLLWDLPRGTIALPTPLQSERDADPAPAAAASVSVRLNAGVRARIERFDGGQFTVRFERSPHFASCANRQAIVRIDTRWLAEGREAERTFALNDQDTTTPFIVYRSGEPGVPAAPPPADASGAAPMTFVLALEGRIVIGEAIPQGSGWDVTEAPPLLESGEVRVRSRAGWTHQSIELLQEQVDAGSVVDSAACFQQGPFWPDHLAMWRKDPARAIATVSDEERPRFCTAALEAPAFGFVRALRDGAMEVQLHTITYQLAITPHQGETRLLGLTLWQHLVHSHLAQAVVAVTALLVGVGNLVTLYRMLRPSSDAPPRRRRRDAATRRPVGTLPPKEAPLE